MSEAFRADVQALIPTLKAPVSYAATTPGMGVDVKAVEAVANSTAGSFVAALEAALARSAKADV